MADTGERRQRPYGMLWETFKRFLAHPRDRVPGGYFSGAHFQAGSLIPVRIQSTDAYKRTLLQPRESCWTFFTAWLRYHFIQARWDVERALARLLHRRWH